MIKTPASCTKLSDKAPLAGETHSLCSVDIIGFPKQPGYWTVLQVLSLIRIKYFLWEVLQASPWGFKNLFPKALYSLKQPRRSAIKQCRASALPWFFSMYDILELDLSSRNYLRKADLKNQIQIQAYYLIAKQITVHSKKAIFYCKGSVFVRQPYLKIKIIDPGCRSPRTEHDLPGSVRHGMRRSC